MSYHRTEKANPKHEAPRATGRAKKNWIAAGELIVLVEDECHLLMFVATCKTGQEAILCEGR